MPGILTMRDVCDGAVAVAMSKIGVHEDPRGSNSGTEVNAFLASVGLPPGKSWCAAFLHWCFMRSSAILSTHNPCPRSGRAVGIWEASPAHCKSMVPRRGSVYVVDHGGGKGHIGIVINVDPDGRIQEVSGNTNQEGAREGDSVWQHSFRLTDDKVHGGKLLGFIDFAADVDNATVAA